MTESHREVHRRSLDDAESFWLEQSRAITWVTPPTRALDASRAPFHRWFPDGVLNTAYNCLDRHVEGGRAEQAALIYDSPITGTQRTLSYRELRDEVAQLESLT